MVNADTGTRRPLGSYTSAVSSEALAGVGVIVAAVLAASAVGKLRHPEEAMAAFDALRVPPTFARPWMRRAHPWVELLVAVGVVAAPAWWGLVAALCAAALSVAYLGLVLAAVRRPTATDCACFGASRPVSRVTVYRNAWLLLLAAVWVASSLRGVSPASTLLGSGEAGSWFLVLAAGAVMTGLVVHSGPSGMSAGSTAHDLVTRDDDLEDYVREVIPHVPVITSSGESLSLRQLAAARPQLLLAVSPSCSSCVPTIAEARHWADRLPEVSVSLLFSTEPSGADSAVGVPVVHDPQQYAVQALRLPGTPSAVLLGADGMLAGGPVSGHDAIDEFVSEIDEQLALARGFTTAVTR